MAPALNALRVGARRGVRELYLVAITSNVVAGLVPAISFRRAKSLKVMPGLDPGIYDFNSNGGRKAAFSIVRMAFDIRVNVECIPLMLGQNLAP
jgi:hypothetical protein